MFKNYLKISLRTLAKNKAYTLINVCGLALSLTCGILIFTLVSYHLSFDDFHKNSDRVYRIVTEQHRDNVSYVASVPPALARTFRNDYTMAEQTVDAVVYHDDFFTIREGSDVKKFKQPAMAFVENGYFDIFNFPLVQGDLKTALAEPNTALITQATATKCFGNADPINKIILIENRVPVKITGVLKDLPANTDLQAQIFMSYATVKSFNSWLVTDDAWGGITSELQCFTRLKPNINPAQVEKVLQAYVAKYRPKSRNVHHYKLQPLADIHFDAQYGGVMQKRSLWILSFVGLFIIVTACVNFVNLATAQALNRTREIGVRKVLGSLRLQLFWQFIAETGLITIMALALAICMSLIALPYVNQLFNTQMAINIFNDWRLGAFMLGLVIVVTFLAGFYPGLIITRFKPVAALKGKISGKNVGSFNTRRALIITQFAISQVLIIGMIIVSSQMHYAKDSDLGFDKDAVVMVPTGNDTTGTSINTFKARVAALTGVQKVTACFAPPSAENSWGTSVRFNNAAEDEIFSTSVKAGDDQYISAFGVDLVVGRNLYPSDSTREFLVNETFVRKLNLKSPADILNKPLTVGGNMKGLVVGVVKDFHTQSFHADIDAICICSQKSQYQTFGVKINMNNAHTVLPGIEKAWNDVYANQIYNYQFLDDQIAAFYKTEEVMLKLIQVFAGIAIFIGCLGLYGLVMFMASQKTKEIGIRKVLGSSIGGILWIFGREFAGLIFIAFVIAAPIAGWMMNSWLEDFKFRIPMSPLFFAATILLMLLIAAFTVGYRAIKTALMNPVKAIRTE